MNIYFIIGQILVS